MPWRGDEPPFGFSASPDTWLPIPPEWATLTVEHQLAEPDSPLTFFQRAIELRRGFDGTQVEWLEAPNDVLIFRVGGGLVCVLNAGAAPAELPSGDVLLASAHVMKGMLPPNAAAWLI
jgi:alpha-glucosidase